MDDLDLDSFIANIEQTAPDDNLSSRLICKECNVQLEEGEDGNYVCPNCSAQATGILQLDDTELHHDDQGRPVYGQRIRTTERVRKHRVDYGWGWSTDDAVAHILGLQVDALEQAKLLPELFRPTMTNMWLKFWLDNVAPHIKDSYDEDELIPLNTKKVVKLRDIEVLVKVRNKVMIPTEVIQRKLNVKKVYKMYGSHFHKEKPAKEFLPETSKYAGRSQEESSSTSSSMPIGDADELVESTSDMQEAERDLPMNLDDQQLDEDATQDLMDAEDQLDPSHQTNESDDGPIETRNLSEESITILTLNRALAFIEATARCMNESDPLFAADIIRACNQRLIPFYNASKLLPAGMNLNLLDKLMFQKTRPPTPIQLTRTASLLIHKVYREQLPKTLPTPDLCAILERFIKDLNLPYELHDLIKNDCTFADFPATRPVVFSAHVKRRLPQYDRWAFAVLLCQLKRLFNLSEKFIALQSERAQMESRNKNEFYFDIDSWVRQLDLRLELILRYDPFVLFHPMAEIEKLECTPQLSKYIEVIMEDRASATIRNHSNAMQFDESYRAELSDFITRQLPLPKGADKSILLDEELDRSTNIRMPLTDAYERTQRSWAYELEGSQEINELVHRSFGPAKLLLPGAMPMWCIYDKETRLSRWKLRISPEWPYAYRLLLNVGAFLCFCDPIELVNEVRLVEEHFFPQAKMVRRSNSARSKQ